MFNNAYFKMNDLMVKNNIDISAKVQDFTAAPRKLQKQNLSEFLNKDQKEKKEEEEAKENKKHFKISGEGNEGESHDKDEGFEDSDDELNKEETK